MLALGCHETAPDIDSAGIGSQFVPVSFTRFSQRIRPIYLLKFTVQRFGSEFAFDLLDES